MSIRIRSDELSPVEVSFLKWQYGSDDADEPFERALWQTIMRAWNADNTAGSGSRHINRLGSREAYPEEVALYLRFRSEGSDEVWNDLIRRAGLADRRTARIRTPFERRRAARHG